MTPKHVAILISALGAGGAERVIAQLARHWVDNGHRITLISFDSPDAPIYHDIPQSVQLERLDCPGAGLVGNLQRITQLKSALKEAKPDVLISFLTKNNLLASLAKKGVPLKWIACERNNPERQKTHPLWNRALDIAYRSADAIICQTEGVKRCFPGAVLDRITVIPNPITPIDRHKQGATGRVAAVGRLDHQKGFDLLIDAFADIAPSHSGWSLDIWGSGAEQAALEQRIVSRSMQGRITLRGISDRPGEWVDEADIFVLSSRYEGFPNVLGEALSAGLPVISTDCDFGPADMITPEQNGLLVPTEDRAALAIAMDRLISDEALQCSLSDKAPQAAARFAPQGVIAKWDEVIGRVCDQQAPHRVAAQRSTQAQPVR